MYLLELTRPSWKYSFHFWELWTLYLWNLFPTSIESTYTGDSPEDHVIEKPKNNGQYKSADDALDHKKHFAHCSQLFSCYLPIQLHITDYMNISWGVSIKKEWNAILWVAKSKCLPMNAIYTENVCRTGRDTRLNI